MRYDKILANLAMMGALIYLIGNADEMYLIEHNGGSHYPVQWYEECHRPGPSVRAINSFTDNLRSYVGTLR
jgi:hypothetical protein